MSNDTLGYGANRTILYIEKQFSCSPFFFLHSYSFTTCAPQTLLFCVPSVSVHFFLSVLFLSLSLSLSFSPIFSWCVNFKWYTRRIATQIFIGQDKICLSFMFKNSNRTNWCDGRILYSDNTSAKMMHDSCSYLTFFFSGARRIFFLLALLVFFLSSLRCARSDEFTSRISPFNTHLFFCCSFARFWLWLFAARFFFAVTHQLQTVLFEHSHRRFFFFSFWRCVTKMLSHTHTHTVFCAKITHFNGVPNKI